MNGPKMTMMMVLAKEQEVDPAQPTTLLPLHDSLLAIHSLQLMGAGIIRRGRSLYCTNLVWGKVNT